MFGGPSIQIARLFGIRIGASPSWFVVLFLFILLMSESFRDQLDASSTEAYLVAVAAAFLFFVSVVLHELGHALVARREGIGIKGIDLWFFGGLAKMTSDARTPGAEFRLAAAGPLANVVLVLLCAAGLAISGLSGERIADVAQLYDIPDVTAVDALLGFALSLNLLLVVVNIVPAFPLDGGRMALAVLWRATGDRTRATRFTGRAGQGLGVLLMGLGIFLVSQDPITGVYCGVIGWFIYGAARGAVLHSAFSERLEDITVAAIMDPQPVAMPAATVLSAAEEEWFLRYGWDWFPVVDADGRYRGLVRRADVDVEIAAGRPALAVSELLPPASGRGAQAPFSVPDDEPLEALLGDVRMREHGALMAVDAEGVLCGVVTVEQIRRALTSAVA